MVKQFNYVLFRFFRYLVLISRSFLLQIFSWLSNFAVLFRFASIFSLHFAYFELVFASDFAVSLRCKTSEIMPLIRF
jgi:hypothetical protein